MLRTCCHNMRRQRSSSSRWIASPMTLNNNHYRRMMASSVAVPSPSSATTTTVKGARRVLSGIQPTGDLHLGNYLGAISNWVALQPPSVSSSNTASSSTAPSNTSSSSSAPRLAEGDRALYCIVNLHAITIPQPPATLLSSTRDMAAALLACGIDPARSTLFAQSALGGYHGELTWLLGCSTPMSMLKQMTQYKVGDLISSSYA